MFSETRNSPLLKNNVWVAQTLWYLLHSFLVHRDCRQQQIMFSPLTNQPGSSSSAQGLSYLSLNRWHAPQNEQCPWPPSLHVTLFWYSYFYSNLQQGGGPENANIFGSFLGHIVGIWPPKWHNLELVWARIWDYQDEGISITFSNEFQVLFFRYLNVGQWLPRVDISLYKARITVNKHHW